jgi:hypothetical protein
MDKVVKEFAEGLISAEKKWRDADHFIYVTMPVVRDEKLLLRALDSVHQSAVQAVSIILKFEYFYKRVVLSKDSKRNLDTFFRKCGGRYGLGEVDKDVLKRLFVLGRAYKESGMDFVKSGKVVMMDGGLGITKVSVEDLKEFLHAVKKLLRNANRNFQGAF